MEAETVVRSGNPSQHYKTSNRYYHSESSPHTLGRKGSLSLDPKFATKRSVLDSFGGESDDGLKRSSFSTNSSSIPRSSSTLSRKSSIGNIWSKLSRRQDVWDRESLFDQDGEDEEESNFVATCLENTFQWLRFTLKTACSSPFILIVIALVFTILCTCGILVTDSFDRAETEARIENAKTVAQETDVFFQRVLERAFVPLFTIAQFVKTVDIFHDMPFYVGDFCSSENITDCTDTAGFVPAPNLKGKESTHRDLNGIFKRGELEQFEEIASSIKKNSGLGKALFSVQLAPKAVVSAIYPMINCEDFDGFCVNNTGAWGHDLLNDPNRVGIARATVPATGVVTAGPLNLVQGGSEAFIARLAINMPGHRITLDGTDYPCWGFAVILLNWNILKDDSNIYETFQREGMQFKLTRTDIKIENGIRTEHVKIIAQSDRPELIAKSNLTMALDTSDNGWVISIGYNDGFSPNYSKWAYPTTICLSFVFTILIMLVLVSKKEHEKLLGKLMPARVIKKLRRNQAVVERYSMVTIFFSDIVGYTEMASDMNPTSVMKMLNKLYSEFDKLAEKHGVFKVETIGDAYIAVGGAPTKCSGPEAAEKVTLFALEAIEVTRTMKADNGSQILIRAGLASGPIVAGVVGSNLPKYTLFGDTVNFASRMESTSVNMRLQIAPITRQLLLDAPRYSFECEQRFTNDEPGLVVKGKGRQFTYWVNSFTELSKRKGKYRVGASSSGIMQGEVDEEAAAVEPSEPEIRGT